MGVVVRRYIDILTIILNFPYILLLYDVLFWQQHPYFFVHFLNVFANLRFLVERSELYVRIGWRISLVYIYIYIYIYIFVSMGRPFGPAWAPRNAQRANVGPAGLGSMVNVIALKTATLVLAQSALPN